MLSVENVRVQYENKKNADCLEAIHLLITSRHRIGN
jgi:hypothetical protein